MKINVKSSDVIWSYTAVALQLLSGLIILPAVLKFLDDKSIALYYVFVSLSSISTFFDFGFSASFSRNITYCWSGCGSLKKEGAVTVEKDGETDFHLMKKVLLVSKAVYGIISFIALICGCVFGTLYVIKVGGNDFDVIAAWLIYVLSTVLMLYFGYYSAYLRGVGNIKTVNIILVVSKCIQLVIMLLLLLNGAGLIGVGVSGLIYNAVFMLSSRFSFYKYCNIGEKLKAVKEKITFDDAFSLFKIIWFNTWREGLISFSNYVLNQSGTIICSLYFSYSQTGIYSVAVQISSAISTVAATLYNTYQPSLQSSFAERNVKLQKKYMSVIVVSYIIIFFAGLTAFIFAGRPVLKWLKPSYNLSVPVILSVSFYQFILKFRNCYTTYFSSTNRLIYYKSFLISAFICVMLSVLSAEFTQLGIYGLVLSQIISQVIFNAWYWTLKAHKEMKLGTGEMILLFKDEIKNLTSDVFKKVKGEE